jgi:hypothetical protein
MDSVCVSLGLESKGRDKGGEVGWAGFGPNAHFSDRDGARAWLWGWVGGARDLVVGVEKG